MFKNDINTLQNSLNKVKLTGCKKEGFYVAHHITDIGLGAVGLYLLSYQLKKRKHIVWATCISNALYVLQYLLLGAFSGAIMDFMSTVSSFFAAKKNDPPFNRYIRPLAFVNMAAIAVVGLISAFVQREWIELLPIAGALLQTGGLWCNNEQTIRKFGLCSAPLWLVYNYISQAYGAALGSVIAIVSIIIAMVRYRKKFKTTKNNIVSILIVNGEDFPFIL